jgi:hypothetical protein
MLRAKKVRFDEALDPTVAEPLRLITADNAKA